MCTCSNQLQPHSRMSVCPPRDQVSDGGAWRGPDTKTWVERIARGSTMKREYAEDGSFRGWVNSHLRDG